MTPRFSLSVGFFAVLLSTAGAQAQGETAEPAGGVEAAPEPASAPSSATASEPSEAAKQEAADRFRRGLSFYSEGDYGLALIEFERAYQLVPDYRVLYNIGQVSIQLSRASQALRSLEQYLEQGGEELAPERVESVKRDLDMLRARTALLGLTGTEGAQVFLDDERVGVLPLEEPLLVDAGRHRVEVKKDGFRTFSERLTLAGSEERELVVVLKEQPKMAPVVALPAPTVQAETVPLDQDVPPPTSEARPPYALIGWSTTGVLAVGALVSGGIGLSSSAKLKDLKSEANPDPDELDQKSRAAKSWFLAADLLGIAAVASGSVSLYFTLKGRGVESQSARLKVGRGDPPGKDLRVQVAPSRIAISGSF